MTSCDELMALAEEAGVSVTVKDGRLSIRGDSSAVDGIVALAMAVKDELLARLTAKPAIEPTHRTTRDLIFNDPETGTVRKITAGTLCRRFASSTGAMMAGVKLDYMGEWAANKNIERGYCLIWIEGALRGVHFSDVEPLLKEIYD